MTLSVLVPTWRRPVLLTRCLAAIGRQSRPAAQVVVTVRQDDADTWAALRSIGNTLAGGATAVVPIATGPVPLTAAMNAGLAATTGELVALTDDDSEPRPDWLERSAAALADPTVGGAGGRDWQPGQVGREPTVGVLTWFGRPIGNHHFGVGPPREVDLLKGVNCCFRGELLRALGFDRRLRGRGNVSHWEMALCFALRRAGWRLVYDPAIAVDHNFATRMDGDVNARSGFEPDSFAAGVHNETLSLLEYLPPPRKLAYLAWATAVGNGSSPGLAQLSRLVLRPGPHVVARWWAGQRGRAAGLASYLRRQRPAALPPPTRRGARP